MFELLNHIKNKISRNQIEIFILKCSSFANKINNNSNDRFNLKSKVNKKCSVVLVNKNIIRYFGYEIICVKL